MALKPGSTYGAPTARLIVPDQNNVIDGGPHTLTMIVRDILDVLPA